MSLLVIQHQTSEVTARLGQTLQSHGHRQRIVHPNRDEPLPPDLDDIDGVVIMGGAMNVSDTDEHPWIECEMALIRMAHETDIPIVGICLGAQLLAAALGGEVGPMEKPQIGWANVKLAFPGTVDPIYAGITWDSMQLHIHGQEIKQLPPNATPLAGSAQCRTQAFRVGLRSYGFQYHFECDRALIQSFAASPFATSCGISMHALGADTETHYEGYARQSERLCRRIAQMLLPIDRR